MIIIFNWIRTNLLASKLDVLLSLLGAYFIYLVTSIFLTFVFTSDWTLIEVNRKILLLGLFPDDQIWRIWVLFAISSILISATLSYTYRFNIKTGRILASNPFIKKELISELKKITPLEATNYGG